MRGTAVVVGVSILASVAAPAAANPIWADTARAVCADPAVEPPPGLAVERRPPAGAAPRVVVRLSDEDGTPLAEWRFRNGCEPAVARSVHFDGDTLAALSHLDPVSGAETSREDLNPAVPAGRDPGGVRVGHIDTGIVYTLALFEDRLARDGAGALLGHDLWDGDARPFDLDIGASVFQPRRHGTAVASIVLREAPAAALVPVRYPRPDMARMGDAVDLLHDAGVRIVVMPLGSNRADLWDAFAEAALAASGLLFIVSAGNDGRDIDADPVYPAALDVPNMVVVTSADGFGRLAPGSNWGAVSVDLMVPGEGIAVIDHRGAKAEASGASFAAPRVAALAARMLAADPTLSTEGLIAALKARARPPLTRGTSPVAWGWIPDPADDF